jgi:MOSC domain-containing protein YiiM
MVAVGPRTVGVFAGRPKRIGPAPGDWSDREWETSFDKERLSGPVEVTLDGLRGDEVADKVNHGGRERAVCAYPSSWFATWRKECGVTFSPGAFGENLTIEGLDEDSVSIGETHRIGSVILQVNQPRSPCWKISRRWLIKDLTSRVHSTMRTGWFYRVLEPGVLSVGDEIEILDRPYPQWSVRETYAIVQHRRHDAETAAALIECELLKQGWRDRLSRRLAGIESD